MGMSHVMEPTRIGDRRAYCGFPEAGAEAGATQRPTGRCSEDQAIVSGVGGNVLSKDVDEPRGDGDGASCCAGLGLSEGEVSGDLREVAFYTDCSFERFVMGNAEAGKLPISGAAVRS